MNVNEFNDLWRRVQILPEDKAPYQVTGAVEDIGKPSAPTGHVAELGTVPEGVDSNAHSVNFRDAQRRVSYWSIRIAGRSAEVSHAKTVVRHARSVRLEGGIRI
jgi:hypothetical protein